MVGVDARRAVGKQLREGREALGLSLRDFSKELQKEGVSVSVSKISRVERGVQEIGFCAVDDMIAHLGLPPALLHEVARAAKPKRKVPPGFSIQELLRHGRELGVAGAFKDALAHFEEVEARHASDPDAVSPDDLAYALELQATVHSKLRHRYLAHIALQKIRSLKGVSEDILLRGYFTQVFISAMWGDFTVAEAIARLASDRIDRASQQTRLYGFHVLGHLFWLMKRFAEAIPFFDQALESVGETEKTPDHLLLIIAKEQCAWEVLQKLQSIHSIKKATEDANSLGFGDVAAWGHRVLAKVFFDQGKLEECRAEGKKSQIICRSHRNSAQEFFSLFWIWKASLAQGDRGEVGISAKAMRRLLPSIDQTDDEVVEFLAWVRKLAKEGSE